jgi:hypothetical protein
MKKLTKTRSGGPQTIAGRATCSRNALKSGAYSLHLLLDDEDKAEFETLCNDLLQDEKPQNTVQHILVSKLAEIQWRIKRLGRYELTIYRQLTTVRITTHEWTNHLGFNFQELLDKCRQLTDSTIESGPDTYLKGLAALEAVYQRFPTEPPELLVLKQAHGFAYHVLITALSIDEAAFEKALRENALDDFKQPFWLRTINQARRSIQRHLDALDANDRVGLAIQAIRDARIREYLLDGRHTRPMQELYRLFFKTVAELRKEQEIHRAQKAVLLNPARTQGFEHDESEQLITEVT